MSIMVGVGRGARLGVLIKNAEALERMEKVDTLVVDKTGTLTEGRPSVTAVVPSAGFDRGRRCCGSPPRSNAPPSTRWPAPSSSAAEPTPACASRTSTDFDAPAGKGVIGTVEGRRVVARQRAASWPATGSTPTPLTGAGRRAARRRRHRRLRRRRRPGSPGSSPSPTRSRTPPPRRWRRCAPTASRSSCSPATTGSPPRPSPAGSASTGSRPRCCPTTRATSSSGLRERGPRRRDGRRRRQRRPRPRGRRRRPRDGHRAPTWPSRAPASPCSTAT